MAKLVLFNKPFQVMSQFSRPEDSDKQTLADFIDLPAVYPAGRLDYDSEGLLLLTNNGQLQHQIAHPNHKAAKVYWVQVEGIPNEEALNQLRKGVLLKDGPTRPALVSSIPQPDLWERNPPVRFRANIPTSWLEITITEGRNRQVRRMTAAVGFPTLRLIRAAIGEWHINGLQPGEFRVLEVADPAPKPKHAGRKSQNQAARTNNGKTANKRHRQNETSSSKDFAGNSKSGRIPRRKKT